MDWIFKADYREGKPLDEVVKNLIYKLGVDNKLIGLSIEQKTKSKIKKCRVMSI